MSDRIEIDRVTIPGLPNPVRGGGSCVQSTQAEMWLEGGYLWLRPKDGSGLRVYDPAGIEMVVKEKATEKPDLRAVQGKR